MVYESLLVAAIVFAAGSVFLFMSGGQPAVTPLARFAQGVFVLLWVYAYFAWCWRRRGGQTLPMKAWGIRLVGVTPARGLLRFALAVALVPTLVSIVWALFDRERQFLHDRLAGTRLVEAKRS